MTEREAAAQIQKEFWNKWTETTMGKLRPLSREKLADYYDYFARFHYGSSPEAYRDLVIASEDRMAAIQSELQHRRTRDVQLFVAAVGVVVLIGIAIYGHSNPSSGNANTEHPRIQISPRPTVSNKEPNP